MMIHGRTSRFLIPALGVFLALVLWQRFQSRQNLSELSEPRAVVRAPELPRIARGRQPFTRLRRDSNEAGRGAFSVLADPEQAPAWTVRYGQEFWRRLPVEESAPTPAPARGAVQSVPFSLSDVIERVQHALEIDPESGVPSVRAATYGAWFEAGDLRFSPNRPASDGMTAANRSSHEGAGGAERSPERPTPDPSAEIRVRTISVERGAETFFAAGRDGIESSAVGNVAQALLSRDWGVLAHFEAGEAGIEMAWVLSNLLPGAGPIDVTFSVEGMDYVGATEQGHHFADSTGTARVRVEQAFAVDAAGTRWELAMEAAPDGSGRLRIRLPAEVQAEAVFPVAIDPLIGSEFGMDQPVSSPALGSQGNSAVAATASGFLVVWEDTRNAGVTSTDIYGTRVSNAGLVLDPLGIAICTASGVQSTPAIAWSGSMFLVVWRDTRLGNADIFGARLSSAGAILDPIGFPISVDPSTQTAPAVAGNATGFLVAWQDDRSGGGNPRDIYGSRVNTSGVVLDPAGIGICTNASNQSSPAVAVDGSGFFVAWEDDRNSGTTSTDIYGTRVSSAGLVREPTGVTLCNAANTQTQVAASANGTNILIAWRDRRNQATTGFDIFATRVTTAGDIVTVLDPVGFGVSTNATTQQTPSVGRSADGFLVAWRDARNGGGDDIYAARVGPDGMVQDPSGLIINTNANLQSKPAVAGNAGTTLVVWTDPRNSASPFIANNIYGGRVTSAGVLVETNHFPVSLAGAVQAVPAVAFNGTNYLVVWQDERNFSTNASDIFGARVTPVGKVADPAGIRICALPGAQAYPAVGTSAGSFLVVWEDSRNSGSTFTDVYGTRVTFAGAVADPAGLAISTAAGNQTVPSVAGNATTYLVAWQDTRNGGGGSPDIFCATVNQAGVVGNNTAISTIGTPEFSPKTGGSSNGFMVVWEDNTADILGARVNNAGTVLDPSGSAISICANGTSASPNLAALGTNFLVVWSDTRSSADTGSDIYAARVFGDGTVQETDGFALWPGPGDQQLPAVAATAAEYVVVWEDQRAGEEFMSARVATDGVVLDPLGVPLPGSGDRTRPAVVAGNGGKMLLVSQGFRKNSQRIAANLLTGDPALSSPLVQFGSAVFVVAEAGKFAKIKVGLKGKYAGVITVDLATVDGTATAGADYLPQATRLVFSTGKTSLLVSIPILNDTAVEGNETLTLTLRDPAGGALLGPIHTTTLTIVDDD